MREKIFDQGEGNEWLRSTKDISARGGGRTLKTFRVVRQKEAGKKGRTSNERRYVASEREDDTIVLSFPRWQVKKALGTVGSMIAFRLRRVPRNGSRRASQAN